MPAAASETMDLKDNSEVDKIIVKKQPHQLLKTNREFLPSFDASNLLVKGAASRNVNKLLSKR